MSTKKATSKSANNNNVKVEQNEPLTIGLCGQVSAGKTSFLNAICGGFIGCVALTRETIKSEQIQLRVGAEHNFGLYEKEMLNIRTRNAAIPLTKITEHISNDINIRQPNKPLPSLIGRDINIIDFPGVNDTHDKNGEFLNVVFANLERLDILIYITSAETAFTLASEVDLFNKIKAKVNELNKNGNAIYLITVVNKVDDPHNIDYKKVINNIPKDIKEKNHFFRVSSHKIFVHYLRKTKITRNFAPDLLNELSKILRNANTVINNNTKKNIKDGKSINFEQIEYNNDILDDGKDNNNNSGDWDELTEFIYNFNNYEAKKKSMQDYADSQMKLSVCNLIRIIGKMMKQLVEIDYKIVKELIMKYFIQESTSIDPGRFISAFYELDKKSQYELLDKLFKESTLNSIQLILFFENMNFFNNIKWYPQIICWIKNPALWISSHNLSYYRYDSSGSFKQIKFEHTPLFINEFQFSPILSKLYDCIPDFKGILKLSTLKFRELYVLHYTNDEVIGTMLKLFPKLAMSLELRAMCAEIYKEGVGSIDSPVSHYILTDVAEKFKVNI